MLNFRGLARRAIAKHGPGTSLERAQRVFGASEEEGRAICSALRLDEDSEPVPGAPVLGIGDQLVVWWNHGWRNARVVGTVQDFALVEIETPGGEIIYWQMDRRRGGKARTLRRSELAKMKRWAHVKMRSPDE